MIQILKDPDELVDWWLCYASPDTQGRLGEDTIASIDSIELNPENEIVVVTSGINSNEITDGDGLIHSPSTAIAIWLAGGIAGKTYEMTVTFTTDGGRTYDDALLVRCLNG